MNDRLFRNCAWGFSCDAKWESLVETENSKVKFCRACQREVFNSETAEELVKNISLNRCVSFLSSLQAHRISESDGESNESVSLVGYVMPSTDFDDDIPF